MRMSIALVAIVLVPSVLFSQQRAPTSGGSMGGSTLGGSTAAAGGSSGMFGSRNLGSSLSAGNRGFAGGSSGTNAAAAGVQGARIGQTMQNDASVGQVAGNERFTRGGRQAGQFVGADTTDLPSFLTQIATGGGMGNQQRGGRNQQGQRGGQNANQQQAGRGGGGRLGQQQAQYRVTRSVGFDSPVVPPAQITTKLGTRMKALPGVRAIGPIEVSMQQRTVVLRGSVATAHDRDLAERLALLEAGVDQVQNELTIATAGSVPAPAAAAAATARN